MAPLDYEREMGEIHAVLRHVSDGVARVETKMDTLTVQVCAIGRWHTQQITELRERPAQARAWLVALTSVASAVGGGLGWLLSRLAGGSGTGP
jgi:hypothetical protein